MSMTKEQLLAEAMKLEPAVRGEIADALLGSLTDQEQAEIDAAWLAEARRRDDAFARGEMTASSVDEALDRIASRARP